MMVMRLLFKVIIRNIYSASKLSMKFYISANVRELEELNMIKDCRDYNRPVAE